MNELNLIKEMNYELDLRRWREIKDILKITTNGRWLSKLSNNPIFGNFEIPKRDYLPKPSNQFHGIWIAEIPFQMILRYSKKDDIIWSIFGGSGIDYEICKLLKRNCIINDINPQEDYIQKGDSRTFNPGQKVDMILAHPPYWDIIKYSDNENDGSNKKTLEEFIQWWIEIVNNVNKYLKDNGFFILVCGNIYKSSEEIELGELLKNTLLFKGYTLKQHIIKDYGETKGTETKNYNLNYYRQLKGKYGNFYGDNIYILQKKKSKNKLKEIYKLLDIS